MKPIGLRLEFEAVATVMVPDHLSHTDARLLASKLVLARILVSADNHDSLAFWDYETDCSPAARKTAQADWAAASVEISGQEFTIPDATSNFTDDGIELDDGSILDIPDPDDGEIRRTDENGFAEEVRKPGDEGYREWYDLFDRCFFIGQRVHVAGQGDGDIEDQGDDEGWWVCISGQRVLAEAEDISPIWDDE